MNKIFLIGIGPGDEANMTGAALQAMENADVLCGYTVYIDLVKAKYPEKEYFTSPMTKERERCVWALEQAAAGKTVALLCSGDAGVYGMAGLVLELAEGKDTDIEIIPGISAAMSGAAVLGAPLMSDFCVISLSDYLTPAEMIEKRLDCAALGDFSIVLYNPRSVSRPDHLKNACDVILRHRSPDTVCGWVKNIGREGQESHTMTLAELRDSMDVDMFCTVFIGSSATRLVDGRMVTPRGYKIKQ